MRISDWSSDVCSSDLSDDLRVRRCLALAMRMSSGVCSSDRGGVYPNNGHVMAAKLAAKRSGQLRRTAPSGVNEGSHADAHQTALLAQAQLLLPQSIDVDHCLQLGQQAREVPGIVGHADGRAVRKLLRLDEVKRANFTHVEGHLARAVLRSAEQTSTRLNSSH